MTSVPDSFPNSISHKELQSLFNEATSDAPSEESLGETPSPEQIGSICEKLFYEIQEQSVNQLVPKVLILQLIKMLADWAQANHAGAKEAEDIDSSSMFYALHLQLNQLGRNMQNTYLGPEDFTHPSNQP